MTGKTQQNDARDVQDTHPLLTRDQITRYSRQMNLKELGVEGQRRLLDSKVLCIGAGGLGSPAALYLAAAGVGTLGIVDGDRVELSNLHRQLLHSTDDLGRPKGESARETLQRINPDVKIIIHPEFLTSQNAFKILPGYDLVINGSDNFATRYLVNDACVMKKVPLVDASILRWDAHCAVFLPGGGCYRCLFPDPPPPGLVPNCAEAGVTGALAGHMGTRQALEAIKLLLGVGRPLSNRFLIFDGLTGEYREVTWNRNPSCAVCGDSPTITELIDYEEFCGIPRHGSTAGRPSPTAVVKTQGWIVDAREAAERLGDPSVQWLDVREPNEYQDFRIPGIRLIPKAEVRHRLADLDSRKETFVVCLSGGRSAEITVDLHQAGFDKARNLDGGMIAWMNERLPIERG